MQIYESMINIVKLSDDPNKTLIDLLKLLNKEQLIYVLDKLAKKEQKLYNDNCGKIFHIIYKFLK